MAEKPLKEMDAYDFTRAIRETDDTEARVLVKLKDADLYYTVGQVFVDCDGDLVIETTTGYA